MSELTNIDNPSFGITTSQEFDLHISKHHGDDPYAVGVTQTCEDCGAVFSGNSFTVNEESMDHVAETGHTSFRVDMIGDRKFHESLELPLEPMGALLLTKTREWWDLQEYDSKLEFLSERFRQAGELAKARWIHLPSQVKDYILGWVGESKANEYEHSDEEVAEIGYLDGKNDMKYNARQFMTDKIGDSRKMRIYNSGYHKGKAEQSFESKAEEDYDIATGKEDRGDFTMSISSGKHLAECKHCGQTWILSAYEEAETLALFHLRMKHGITESKADDIDWTEDKPDETPFYCPLCAMVIEETATYDGVFDHNKQVHGMSDEDSETLAKGFTYSNSPPTSEESRVSEWYNPTEWESRIMRRKEKEQRLKSMGLAEITDEYNDPESAVIVRDDYAKSYNKLFPKKTSEGVYDPFIDQKSLDQWKRLSSYASPLLKTSYKKGDYSLDGDDSFGYHGRHLDNLKKDPDGKDDIVYSYKWQKGGETIDEEEERIYNSIIMMIEDEDIGLDDLVRTIQLRADHTVDPAFGKVIADVFEESKHDPENTKVKRAYATFIKETIEQAVELQKEGIEFDPNGSEECCKMRGIGINCGQDGNYADAYELFNDVLFNKHIYYKTSTDDYDGFQDHPLYEMSEIKNIDGENMRANDLFRCVHDINAHTRVRGQFNPDGEQQAYLEHKKLYSADAIRALFTETQGQGNWVNFNSESGEDNIKYQETGELDKLSFPEQKAFLYPDGIIF